MANLVLILAFAFFTVALGAPVYDGKEAWGYVNVRKDAYMFWWLYYTDVGTTYASYPLIIWLQGGPGASSSGYGNFMEIGPLDVNLKPRNTTWVKKANLLFLDNPVGTGFSYVTNNSALAKNNAEIAQDLVTALTAILETAPEFQKSPLYIFGESYGGKMAIDFSLALVKAVKDKKVICNFKGVALGDSWISPLDSLSTWGQYLYTMSFLDKVRYQDVNVQVTAIKKAMLAGQFKKATDLQFALQESINNFTRNVNWYNILVNSEPKSNHSVSTLPKDHRLYKAFHRMVDPFYGDPLTELMNGKIREKLHVIPKNVTWGGKSSDVFDALSEDFMKPVIDSVDMLLNETRISLNVYTGQLDLIVDTLGTLQWIDRLKWPGLKGFTNAPRKPITQNKVTVGFSKSFKQFNFFWILKAGHMVPSDAGCAALSMLDMVLNKKF